MKDENEAEKRRDQRGANRVEQVIELAAEGFVDKEIAEKLGIKEPTVIEYWRRLRQKTGLKSRTAIVADYIKKKANADAEQVIEEYRRRSEEAEKKADEIAKTLLWVQKDHGVAKGQQNDWTHFDRASFANHTAVYQLHSISPPMYEYFSPSGEKFGVNIGEATQGLIGFVDFAWPEDLLQIMALHAGATYLPSERYVFIFRFQMPEPRWILDMHRGIYNEEGELTGVTGIIVDIHDLVEAGIIPAKVIRHVVTSEHTAS